MLVCELLGLLSCDLSLLREIRLVSDQKEYWLTVSMPFNFADPVLQAFKTCFVVYCVGKYDPISASIVHCCEGPESLLPSSVPDLLLHLLVSYFYRSHLEI
mmetsp:Transcript_22863/g.17323  ORF Transcript_22863/g.17323 Transcript_22863/m.17323 type:complete len:101 (-) Transcript_22863:159-461(-)